MPLILTRTRDLLLSDGRLDARRRRSLAIAMTRAGYRLKDRGACSDGQLLVDAALELDSDAEAQSWTPRWRPLVRALGYQRAGRVYRMLRRLR